MDNRNRKCERIKQHNDYWLRTLLHTGLKVKDDDDDNLGAVSNT